MSVILFILFYLKKEQKDKCILHLKRTNIYFLFFFKAYIIQLFCAIKNSMNP